MQEESPDFIGQRRQITTAGRNPKESATENIPPRLLGKGEKVV